MLVAPLDRQGLLSGKETVAAATETPNDDELLAELKELRENGGITDLRHVRKALTSAAEEIANRTVCKTGGFEPIFERVKRFKSGIRHTLPVQAMESSGWPRFKRRVLHCPWPDRLHRRGR